MIPIIINTLLSLLGWKSQPTDSKVKKVRKIDQELLNAAYFGNAPLCRKFIAMGGDVEYMEQRDGWLGIHYAARWGDMSMLKSYIKAGANIDGKTNSKETALHKCGRWDRKEAALYLLSLGANPSCKNGDGNKASDMTADPEMKFLLDNYEEYLVLDEQRRKDELDKDSKTRSYNLSLGITSSQVSSRLYDSSINSQLTIDMNAIFNASPKKSRSNTSSNNSSSNNSVNSKSSSPRSPRSVTSIALRK